MVLSIISFIYRNQVRETLVELALFVIVSANIICPQIVDQLKPQPTREFPTWRQ